MKNLKNIFIIFFIALSLFFSSSLSSFAQVRDLLSSEETFWLKGRNNTIVVYPEKNDPPYSYQNASGNIQGLSIDYIELIAEKIGAKVQYLTPRSRSQINTEITEGKGDVMFAAADKETDARFVFTESYAVVPVVIVVRKDYDNRSSLTLNDFNGKRVAMVEGSFVESYVATNYPRVVREEMTDDEVSLQQVVLGEVEGAVMDVASLSFYLSKQVLSSVKIAGNTGLDYKPAFAMTVDKKMLQSILEKGLTQVSQHDRDILVEKWITLPGEAAKDTSSPLAVLKDNLSIATIYVLFGVGVLTVTTLLVTRRSHREKYFRKVHDIHELKDDFSALENQSAALSQELLEVKAEEERLKEKIRTLGGTV